MVKWLVAEDTKLVGVRNVSVDVGKVFNTPWDKKSYNVNLVVDDANVSFDLSKLFSPVLGNFWRVLYSEGDFDGIRDAMLNYYQYCNKPVIESRVLQFNRGDEFTVGTQVINDKKREKHVDINELIKGVNKTFNYEKVVVGTDGDHVEFQFLCPSSRLEAKKDDLLDPGLFVAVNGQVQVSAGVNRLVCTNGLVQQMFVFEGKDYNFGGDFLQRAVGLAKWLVEKQHDKVDKVSSLSAILHCYPKPMVTKFIEEWSKLIENNELTYFDVIDDITRYAGTTLNKTRYQILSFRNDLNRFLENRCCPVCASHLNGVALK